MYHVYRFGARICSGFGKSVNLLLFINCVLIFSTVIVFLLGWVVYGMALDAFMKENTNQCAALEMKDMNMMLMVIGNLTSGLVMALILSWANVTNFMGGL